MDLIRKLFYGGFVLRALEFDFGSSSLASSSELYCVSIFTPTTCNCSSSCDSLKVYC